MDSIPLDRERGQILYPFLSIVILVSLFVSLKKAAGQMSKSGLNFLMSVLTSLYTNSQLNLTRKHFVCFGEVLVKSLKF